MRRRRRAHAPLLAAALVVLAACASTRGPRAPGRAPEAARSAFEVPGRGALELAVPAGWVAETGPGDPPAPMTVRLRRPGEKFLALVTPFWNPGAPEDATAQVGTAQVFAELARRKALGGAVEQEIPLEELVGPDAHGFWFAATDRELEGKEPGPDEWRHLLQGAAAVGPLVVAFTLLDDGPGPQRAEFLEMIRGARHAGGGEGEEREEGEEGAMEMDPDARTVPLRVAASGRPWSVLVDLPGFRMFKPHEGPEGSSIVLGQDPESLVVGSVILRRAAGARDAAGCREADLARVLASVEGIGEVRRASVGGVARASYPLDDGGPQLHAHAWLHRDGICVNVHLSKIEPEPEDGERMERILGSVRFGEDL